MVKITLIKQQVFEWIKNNKGEFVCLVIILLVASVTRLYRISDYMTFLGDEGRDVIIVRQFLQHGDIMLIGPGTSIGNMYLGPIYYYMMAPALLLANFSPVGPAVMIALLGVATVGFIWWAGRKWFSPIAGLIAAALYAIAPTVIIYSRSSWNPNIMPFFALLLVWGVWKFWVDRKPIWIAVSIVSLAFCLQSHYLALILAPLIALFLFITLVMQIRARTSVKRTILFTVLGTVVFLLLMSPLLIFDLRHNWMNFNAMKLFFTERQTTVSIKPWSALPGMIPQLTLITNRLVTGYNEVLGNWIALLVIAGVALAFIHSRFRISKTSMKAFLLLGAWIGLSLLGLALYKQHIYDHYYGFMFPALFIVIGGILSIVWGQYRFRGAWLALTVFGVLVWANLLASPLQYSPNGQYARSAKIGKLIVDESKGIPFNFAVIADRNYEGAYQYFLETAPGFQLIEPQDTDNTIAPQLFVVCEMPEEKCDPTHSGKTGIANFGWSVIENTWNIDGFTIYKLGHSYPPPEKTLVPKSK